MARIGRTQASIPALIHRTSIRRNAISCGIHRLGMRRVYVGHIEACLGGGVPAGRRKVLTVNVLAGYASFTSSCRRTAARLCGLASPFKPERTPSIVTASGKKSMDIGKP